MPFVDERVPPVTPPTPEAEIISPLEDWSEAVAKKRVTQNFDTAESYRRTSHDWRWKSADELYLGWMQQRYWEGTKIPRSSLAVYLTLEHVESMLPKVISAWFGETMWFDSRPYPATSIQEARAVQELILAQARHANEQTGIREVYRRASKSALKYGNGIIHLGWKRGSEAKVTTIDELVPITQPMPTPFGVIQVPTGKNRRTVKQIPQQVEINEPLLEYVPLRDFYIDPNTPSPFPWDAAYAIRRRLVPIKTLLDLSNTPQMSIPPKELLYALAVGKTSSSGDEGIQYQEAMRETSYSRLNDYSVSGEDKRVEVLEYWTTDRLVWLLGRKWVAYNVPNPYDKIPFYNIFYVDVLDRFYALAMSDVLEPEQRLQQSIINARIDELALSIHPPMTKVRGTPIPISQLRRRPGLVTEVDNQDQLQAAEITNVTEQAFVEIAASEVRAQRRDGISDLAVLGTPGAGGSVNRTATGINTLSSASFSRIGYFIENVQENVIVPMLSDWLNLNKKFNTKQDVVKILGTQGQLIELDAGALLRASIRFEMRASNKANSKSAMMQVVPWVAQTLLNPAFIQLLNSMGKTVDIEGVADMIFDATGYRPYKSSLIRPLTPPEIQQMQQGAIDQTKLMTQRIRGETQLDVTQESKSADLMRELIKLKAAKEKEKKSDAA